MNNFIYPMLGTVYPGPKIIFFYKGWLSQWNQRIFHSSSVKADVSSAEEAMMLYKAMFFKDEETFDLIRKAAFNPMEQKRLGRLVKNYDDKLWGEVRFKIVCEINYDKFSQAKEYRNVFLLTAAYELVEASPVDRIWGIGMDVGNPDILNRLYWGQNLLGKAIMHARSLILDEEFNRQDQPKT